MPTGQYERRKYSSYSDPHVELTEVERAYLAGVIDGEGSIMLINRKPRPQDGQKYEYWQLRIAVANCDKRLIDWLVARFGGGVSVARSLRPNCRDVYHWRIDSKRALPILNAAKPYLLLKGEQADLALEMIATHKMVGCKGHSKETVEQRRAMAAKMRSLNSRGKEIPRWEKN